MKEGGSRTARLDVTTHGDLVIAERSSGDFDRAFKPFLLRKGKFLAPINVFADQDVSRRAKGKTKAAEIINIDDDGDVEMVDEAISVDSPAKPKHIAETDKG